MLVIEFCSVQIFDDTFRKNICKSSVNCPTVILDKSQCENILKEDFSLKKYSLKPKYLLLYRQITGRVTEPQQLVLDSCC